MKNAGGTWRQVAEALGFKSMAAARGAAIRFGEYEPEPSLGGKYGAGVLADVARLRRLGAGYKSIGRSLGVSRHTARDLVRRAVRAGLVVPA